MEPHPSAQADLSFLKLCPASEAAQPQPQRQSRPSSVATQCCSVDTAVTMAEGGGAALGKGAWDCDSNSLIPPEKEAEVFEEIATMDYPFEGIPTVPPRKDMDHMAFFCGGVRYRVTAHPKDTVEQVKRRLWAGGIQRSNKPEGRRATPGLKDWDDLELIYAGQRMTDNSAVLATYHVPPGCQVLIAIERAKLELGKPDPDAAWWN